jgi:hypothetical protein
MGVGWCIGWLVDRLFFGMPYLRKEIDKVLIIVLFINYMQIIFYATSTMQLLACIF